VGHLRQLGHVLQHQRLLKLRGVYVAEIDIGIWTQRHNSAAWVRFKSELAQVSLKYGVPWQLPTLPAGDAEHVPEEGWLGCHEEGQAGADPEQHHEPEQDADQAYGIRNQATFIYKRQYTHPGRRTPTV
jgi:hypothetical protein